MWSLGLLALLVSLAVVGLGRPSPATARTLADLVAGELLSARAQAISQRRPIAVRLHSAGGALAPSLSLWRGEHQPRCFKNLNLASEVPGGSIFWGLWPGPVARLIRPAASGETPLDVAAWFAPGAVVSDPMLIFSPEGAAFSNELPLLDGSYRWVTCSGAEVVAAAPPDPPTLVSGRPLFALTAVSQPHTISIDLNGAVHLDAGLWKQDGSVAQRRCSSHASAQTFSLNLPVNSTPVVSTFKISPQVPSSLPTGVSAQVSAEGHVDFSVEAQDSDGDALFCELVSDGGGFAQVRSNKMEWDAQARLWRARWTFRPNPDDALNTHYNIECRVLDERGTPGVAGAGVELTATLELVRPSRLVYGRIPYEELYSMNADGSERRVIPVMQAIRGPADWPSLSPDGSKILFTNQQSLDLWVVNLDGTGARQLTSGRGCYGASWSPDGSSIVFAAENGGAAQLYLMPASGELNPPVGGSPLLPPRQLTAAVELPWCRPGFNATGTKIVTLASPPGSPLVGLYCFDLASNSGNFLIAPEPQSNSAGLGNPSYCPDPAQANLIAFDYGLPGGRQVQVIRDNGSGRATVAAPSGNGWVQTPVWSPSGNQLAYLTDRICIADFSAATGQLSNEKLLLDLAGAYDW